MSKVNVKKCFVCGSIFKERKKAKTFETKELCGKCKKDTVWENLRVMEIRRG